MSDYEELCQMMGQEAWDPDAIDNIIDMVAMENEEGERVIREAFERTKAFQRQIQNVMDWFPKEENFTEVDQRLWDIIVHAKMQTIGLRNLYRNQLED